jgi:release factor glutamine methyltransferase
MISRREAVAFWEVRFSDAGLDSPRLSAQILLARALNLPRLEMLLDSGAPVSRTEFAAFEKLALRRLQGEPVAYLVGRKEFYGLDFDVNPDVLIPRPETELMVDRLGESAERDAALRILDIGTGSGALAVTCAVLFPNGTVTAVDISFAALSVARRNARSHGVADRTAFVCGDLVGAVDVGGFDVILANLPYVPEKTRGEMSREVLAYEPEGALFAGADGLAMYRRLAMSLNGKPRQGALLLCEIDASQGGAMFDLFSPMARDVCVERNYAGLDRLVIVVF